MAGNAPSRVGTPPVNSRHPHHHHRRRHRHRLHRHHVAVVVSWRGLVQEGPANDALLIRGDCCWLCFAKILCALKIARFPAATAVPILIPSPSSAKNLSLGTPSGIPVYIRMEESGRFRDATLVRIRQPARTGGAALPVADVT